MNALELQHITFGYGAKQALFNDFNLNIAQGDFVFVLGANGSGKSSLLKLILGSNRPTTGKLLFNGKTVKSLTQKSKLIGYIPQSHGLDHEMNVEDTLNFIGSYHGLANKELNQRKSFLIDALGIEHLLNKRIKTLSGGQKQLVNICLGLIHDPDFLLIDEPFVGLDYGVKSKIITFLNSINNTILCVSHDLELAENNATKVLLMEHGKALDFRRPADIIADNPYILEELDLKTGADLSPSFNSNFTVVNHNHRLIISCPNTEENKKMLNEFKAKHKATIFSSKNAENNLLSTLVGQYNYTLTEPKERKKKRKKKKK